MSETAKQTNELEIIKAELEATKRALEEKTELCNQYEEAYKELSIKYSRLYGILGNTIEYSLGIK